MNRYIIGLSTRRKDGLITTSDWTTEAGSWQVAAYRGIKCMMPKATRGNPVVDVSLSIKVKAKDVTFRDGTVVDLEGNTVKEG